MNQTCKTRWRDRFAAALTAHALVPVALVALVLLFGLIFLPKLRVEAGLDPFHEKNDPQRKILHQVEQRFVNSDVLVIGYETDDPFSAPRLRQLRRLGESLAALEIPAEPGKTSRAVAEITSLATVDDLRGTDDSFKAEPLVPSPVPDDGAALAAIRRRAEGNALIRDWLLGRERNLAALHVRLEAGLDAAQQAAAVTKVRDVLQRAQGDAPKTRYHLSGTPVLEADTARTQQEDIARFIPVVYLVIAALIFLFVRRIRSVLVVFLVMSLSLLAALATLAALGSSINNCSSALPPVMASLAVALMLHYFSELSKYQREGGLRGRELARHTLAQLGPPVAMAALTTAIGFAALGVSNIPALRDFGFAAAVAMLITFLVGAAAFALLARSGELDRMVSPHAVARRGSLDGLLEGLASLLIRRRFVVLGLAVAFIALGVAGVPRVVVDMNPVTIFSPDTPVRRSTDFIDGRLHGSALMVVAISGPRAEHFTDPAALKALDELEDFLKKEIGAQVVTTPADFVRLMHRELFAGDARYHRLPAEKRQVAQLLLINNDTRIDEFLDHSRRWARVTALLPQGSSFDFADKYARLDDYLAQHFPPGSGFVAHATGRQRLSSGLIKNLVESQIAGLSTAAVLIFGLIFIVFRSWRTGVLAILPNLLPVVAVLAAMGWLGIALDAATVLTATLALGIAVDDTVHFLSGLRARLGAHGDIERAVRETLRLKGPAILWTTLVIGAGFSVLLLSQFQPTRHFGLLITAAMVAALLGDLLLLPALVLCTRSRLGVVGPAASEAPKKNEPVWKQVASILTKTTQEEG